MVPRTWSSHAPSGAVAERVDEGTSSMDHETRSLRQENRDLKKELRRKEKALAETAALLVLKKKAASIWGEPEDD